MSRAGEPRSPLVWVAAFCLLGYAERSLADEPCPPGMQVPVAFQCGVRNSEINIDFRGELDEGKDNTVFTPKIPEDFPKEAKGPVTINFNNYGRIVGVIQNSDSPSGKPLKFNYRQKGGKSSFVGKIGLDRIGYCLSNPDAPECDGDSVSVEETRFVGEIAINRGSVKFIKSLVRGSIDGNVIKKAVTITLRDSEVCSHNGFITGTPDQEPKVTIEGIVLVKYCDESPSAGDDDTSFIPELKDGAALLRSRREYEDRKTLEMALANGDKVGFATDSLVMRMLPADLAISQRLAAISAAQLGYADFAPNDTAPIGAFASLWLKSIYANGRVGARQRQRNSSTLLGVDWAWDGDWNSGFSLGFTHNGDKLTQMGTLKSRGYVLGLYNSKAIRGRALSVESLFIYSRQGNRLASHLPGFIGSGKFASHTLYGRNTIGLNFRPRERLVVTPYRGGGLFYSPPRLRHGGGVGLCLRE